MKSHQRRSISLALDVVGKSPLAVEPELAEPPFAWFPYDPADRTPGLARSESTYELAIGRADGSLEEIEDAGTIGDRDEALCLAVEIARELEEGATVLVLPYQFGSFSLDGFARLEPIAGGDVLLTELREDPGSDGSTTDPRRLDDGAATGSRRVPEVSGVSGFLRRSSIVPGFWVSPRSEGTEEPRLTERPK
jgi:hypothetical protein